MFIYDVWVFDKQSILFHLVQITPYIAPLHTLVQHDIETKAEKRTTDENTVGFR